MSNISRLSGFSRKPLALAVSVISMQMLAAPAMATDEILSTAVTSQQDIGSTSTSYTVTSTGSINITSVGPNGLTANNVPGLTGGILNQGSITATAGTTSTAVPLIGSNIGSFTNEGSITAPNAIVLVGGALGSFTNSSTGVINGRINLITVFDSFDNSGSISHGTSAEAAVSLTQSAFTGDFENKASGVISHTGTGYGVMISGGADYTGSILNQGTISSANATAIKVDGADVAVISNEGTITGSASAHAIDVTDSGSVGVIDNTGTINGSVRFGANGGTFRTLGGTSDEIFGATKIEIGAYGSSNAPVAGVNSTGPATSTLNGMLTFSGDLVVHVNGSTEGTSYGQLAATGDVDLTGSTLSVLVTGDDYIADGEMMGVVTSGGTLTSDISSVEEESLLLDFDVSEENNSLYITSSRNDIADVIEEIIEREGLENVIAAVEQSFGVDLSSPAAVNVLGVAEALNVVGDLIDSGDVDPDSELGKVIQNLQQETDGVRLVRKVQTLEPESGGGSSAGATAVYSTVANMLGSRMAGLREAKAGMVAGDSTAITGFWVQGYGKDTEQELREGIDGYDVDMYGVAIGADGPVNENTTVGFAFSYADSDVASAGRESNDLTIDSYQLSGYLSYNTNDYYIDALASYARNEYDNERNLFTGAIAEADYTGDQLGARVRGGYPFILESGIHIIPNGSLEYTYLEEDDYTETGAGNSGLDVDSQELEALIAAAGIKIAYPFTTESDITWMPDFHVEARYDFIGDTVEIDTNFVGVGGAAFSINGASTVKDAYKAGVGLRAWSQSAFSFMFRYDYLYKEDYSSESLTATVRYSF